MNKIKEICNEINIFNLNYISYFGKKKKKWMHQVCGKKVHLNENLQTRHLRSSVHTVYSTYSPNCSILSCNKQFSIQTILMHSAHCSSRFSKEKRHSTSSNQKKNIYLHLPALQLFSIQKFSRAMINCAGWSFGACNKRAQHIKELVRHM